MRRAQVELSFHWIFVLIAGAVFLGIFFYAIKGCMDTGQSRLRTTDLKTAASTLSATAWQPRLNNTEIELAPLSATCFAGELYLTTPRTPDSEPQREPLDAVPAFLPPSIGGRNRILTSDIRLDASVPNQPAPTLELGSVLYAINEHTYYYIINDGPVSDADTRRLRERIIAYLGPDRNVVVITNLGGSPAVPASAANAVVVSFGTRVDWKPAHAKSTVVRQVVIKPDANLTEFWTYQDSSSSYTLAGSAEYQGELLAIGAAIAGTKDNYVCARTNVVKRMRTVTYIMEGRRQKLTATGSGLNPICTPFLTNGLDGYLDALNGQPATAAGDEAYLRTLFAPNPNNLLLARQRALYERGCPVIA